MFIFFCPLVKAVVWIYEHLLQWKVSFYTCYCLCCCIWFVISSCVELLHLLSGNAAAKTILMLGSFYWPACSTLIPEGFISSHVQNLLFILLIRLIFLPKG